MSSESEVMFLKKPAPAPPTIVFQDEPRSPSETDSSDSSSWSDMSSDDEEQVNIQPINKGMEKRDILADVLNSFEGHKLDAPAPPTDWEVSGEFHSIEKETDSTPVDYSEALKRENARKNRYGNALPNPETRVKIQGTSSDYINANYVKGERSVYIAAQAPLPHTFADFWLMIYQQNTRVIMMLTKLQEKDRTKADVYWPRKGPLSMARGPAKSASSEDSSRWQQYGNVWVVLEKTQELHDEITLRFFRVKHEDFPDVEHQVVQIHYTGWPDFGTPENTQTFHQLLELMEKYNSEKVVPEDKDKENGPIVLHCSAGLGRTGTLIAAHIASEQLRLGVAKSKEDISMKKIVKALRAQRAGMVQTSAQYKFLHHLVKEL